MTNTLIKHKSVRKFKNKVIDPQKLKLILDSTVRASTTGNMQLYSVIISESPEMKQKLFDIHFKQNMVLSAPAVFTFCADFNRFNKWCQFRDAVPGYDNFLSFYTASIDALLAAQNFCIAAEDNGLGICYLGTTTYMADKLIELFELPKGVVPVTTVVAGYPDEDPVREERLPIEAVVHKEKYTDYTRNDIDRFYYEKENLEKTKNLLVINNKDSLAQVFTENRYRKEDNITFSKSLLKVLEKQKFMNNN